MDKNIFTEEREVIKQQCLKWGCRRLFMVEVLKDAPEEAKEKARYLLSRRVNECNHENQGTEDTGWLGELPGV